MMPKHPLSWTALLLVASPLAGCFGALGDTGSARGTAPHLHFFVFPGNDNAGIDPFPLLSRVEAGACTNRPPQVGWSCADSNANGKQLYTCGADGTPVADECEEGCFSRRFGVPDLCIEKAPSWSCARSAMPSGAQFWTCSNGALLKCEGGRPLTVKCANGCTVGPIGTHDDCN
jgi:hypothetical protein